MNARKSYQLSLPRQAQNDWFDKLAPACGLNIDQTRVILPKKPLGDDVPTVESIQAQAAQSGVVEHIRLLGVITDKNILLTVYKAADVHVFPVRHIPDNPEGFGMVAIQAAAYGIATAAFATRGGVDAVRHGESSYLVEPGHRSALAHSILQVLNNPSIDWQFTTTAFAQNLTSSSFVRRRGLHYQHGSNKSNLTFFSTLGKYNASRSA